MAQRAPGGIKLTATGSASGGKRAIVTDARLIGGSDAATATFTDGNGGAEIYKLSAGAGAVDSWYPPSGRLFGSDVYVTITGTGPVVYVGTEGLG